MKTYVHFLLAVATALAAPSSKPKFERGLNKIVGGHDVAPGELPYSVSLKEIGFAADFHFCGGSIYSAEWIITSGNCVVGHDFGNPTDILVAAGNVDLTTLSDTEQTRLLSKLIQHEGYNEDDLTHDIALLKLSTPLTFNAYVQPIALPEPMQDSTGYAVVSGWGVTNEENGRHPSILQAVTVPIVSDEDCKHSYGSNSIYDSMICAGTEGRDACFGDSGGPLACTSGESTYLCGIVSWGLGCARPRFPGVYTEVSYFVNWIHSNSGVRM